MKEKYRFFRIYFILILSFTILPFLNLEGHVLSNSIKCVKIESENLSKDKEIKFMEYQTPPNSNRHMQFKILSENNFSVAEANVKMENIKKAAQSYKSNNYNIPKIWHKIWLTNPDNPHVIPEEVVCRMSQMCILWSGWNHFLWTNIDGLLAQSFMHWGVPLPVNLFERNIAELREEKMFPYVKTLIGLKGFAYAADILRILLIYNFGGGYCDSGWIVNNYFFEKIAHFPYVIDGAHWEPGLVSHTLIYSYPKNKLLKNVLSNVEKYSLECQGDENFERNINELVSPRSITAWCAITLTEEEPLFLFNPEEYVVRYHNQSHVHKLYGHESNINSQNFIVFFNNINNFQYRKLMKGK